MSTKVRYVVVVGYGPAGADGGAEFVAVAIGAGAIPIVVIGGEVEVDMNGSAVTACVGVAPFALGVVVAVRFGGDGAPVAALRA